MSGSESETATILVVEPYRPIQSLIIETLHTRALPVCTAESASAAIARLGEIRPRLLITNQTLPDLCGLGLTAAFKASEILPEITVAMVSVNASKYDVPGPLSPDVVLPKTHDGLQHGLDDLLTLVGLGKPPSVLDVRLEGPVLVADDDKAHRMVLETTLAMAGADVTVATNGVEAVRLAADQNFGLFLLDIEMPHMTGSQAISELRRRGLQTPAVAITAHRDPSVLREARMAGFSSVLPKPFALPILLGRCARYLSAGPNA